jgi:hypothetical protein
VLILCSLPLKNTTVPTFDRSQVTERSRSLPHWELEGGVYFVTFRTEDSIPRELQRAYETERQRLDRLALQATQEQLQELHREKVRLYCRLIDRSLDTGLGSCPYEMLQERHSWPASSSISTGSATTCFLTQ